jgi:hypothetical protein
MLPIEKEPDHTFMPIATCLLGVCLGAAFGIVYEKKLAGLLGILAFIICSGLAYFVIAWMNGG